MILRREICVGNDFYLAEGFIRLRRDDKTGNLILGEFITNRS